MKMFNPIAAIVSILLGCVDFILAFLGAILNDSPDTYGAVGQLAFNSLWYGGMLSVLCGVIGLSFVIIGATLLRNSPSIKVWNGITAAICIFALILCVIPLFFFIFEIVAGLH